VSSRSLKGSNCEALQLEGRAMSRQSFWIFIGYFVVRMRTNCYLGASDQNSEITLDFVTENNDGDQTTFHAVTFDF